MAPALRTEIKKYSTYQVVKDFETRVAEFCGSKYAVSIDSCSNALLLCCEYIQVKNIKEISIPAFTYPSVPCSIIHAGGRVKFKKEKFHGIYRLQPTNIIDAAKVFKRNMYIKTMLMCLSFHTKKVLPIGRGGMILTDNIKAVEWLKCARFDGRHEARLENDTLTCVGHN